MTLASFLRRRYILKAVNEFGQFRLVISCFVLMYDISFGQFIKHADYRFQKLLCFRLVCCVAQSFHVSTCGFMLIAISESFRFVRPDSL